MRLDFLFIGPQKTGTSWIDTQLRNSKNVLLPEYLKETFFFDRYANRGLGWYRKQFRSSFEGKIVGEVAPSYFHCHKASEGVAAMFPNCKIFVTLREPVERIFSLYLYKVKCGDINRDLGFREALLRNEELLESSRYYLHIKRWCDVFGLDRIHVLFYDQLNNDPFSFLGNICDILGIEDVVHTEKIGKRINVSTFPKYTSIAKMSKRISRKLKTVGLQKYLNIFRTPMLRRWIFDGGVIPVISKEDKLWAMNLLSEEIGSLQDFLNVDLSNWLSMDKGQED